MTQIILRYHTSSHHPQTHPLAKLSGQQMGIVYYTDIYGVIEAAITETEPVPSAATLLRDILGIVA